jgi:predicted adenine nucleotide alpha hydrolase (AANH) superfamily ATPase
MVSSNDEDDGTKKKDAIVGLKYHEGGTLPENAPDWAVAASERIQQRTQRTPTLLLAPEGVKRVLLHSCCAPCSGAMVEEMCSSEAIDKVTVFFYNPNIHPKREYEIRKEENKKWCARLGVEFIDCDYDADRWYERMKGMEFDPERGGRCTECFDMRMERAALYAHEHGYGAIATTNATSRWKDVKQVDDSGFRAAARYEGLKYWTSDWQSDSMTLRKYEISAQERFYKQEYCGCSYSLRDSNDWRRANGIPKIEIGGETAGLGERYFSDPIADAAEEAQDVVDEFFAQAKEIAEAGNDIHERKKKLVIYKDRRKNERSDGVSNGINNW